MDYILKLTDNGVKHTVQAMGFWKKEKNELVALGNFLYDEPHDSLQKCNGNRPITRLQSPSFQIERGLVIHPISELKITRNC